MPYLGAHESTGGGLHLAFERLASVGGEALQIFTRNQRQWIPAPLRRGEIEDFKAAWRSSAITEVAAHGSYLVNLASAKDDLLHKSVNAFVLELERCEQLGIPKVIIHPGSHGGQGAEQAIAQFVRGLDLALDQARSQTRVLIETTAGQGTGLGGTFEELAAMLAGSRHPARLGVCLDTCHVFAAGYDLRSAESYRQTMAQFDKAIGLQKIEFIHLNDSKKGLGCRVDRHEHIGQGCLGAEAFRQLLNDPLFADCAMTLETPKDKELEDDRRNLALLRSLLPG